MTGWNARLECWEGDYEASRDEAEQRRYADGNREMEMLERMSKLYAEMAKELADFGHSRRWRSLRQRADALAEAWKEV